MFEKLQKIYTKPGTVATFHNYGKKCCKTQHFRPQQVQKVRGLGVALRGAGVLLLLLLLLLLLPLLLLHTAAAAAAAAAAATTTRLPPLFRRHRVVLLVPMLSRDAAIHWRWTRALA